jgi:protein-tyrosine-phosphatase/Tol biopolymer transport system component
MTKKPSVLFVCVHNAGRSQMAAGYLGSLAAGRIDVRSAGSMPGDQINPLAVQAMAEDGIDVSTESPKALTTETVRDSDVVITMGCGDACPIFPGKRYEDWELEDPAGKDIDTVRRVRNDIRARIEDLIAELLPATGTTLRKARQLRPHQRAEVWVVDVTDQSTHLVFTGDSVSIEAPNWAPDGRGLLVNGDGLLWRLDLDASALTEVRIDDLPPINNDHVLDAASGLIYLSADDGHIYAAPIAGGTAKRITHSPAQHFLHGVSPDGATLAFVEIPVGDFSVPGRLGLISTQGGPTSYPDVGSAHLDGPEYSPDGAWLYFNTEEFANAPGHAQLARIPATGGPMERLVTSGTVDWFPHPSPDNQYATYISFPAGTLGHPADLDVEVRLVRTVDWDTVLRRFPILGGQGTLNVNSWSPDSRHFAFVAYPIG